MLTNRDKDFIISTGRKVEEVQRQIELIRKGREFVELALPATVDNDRITQLRKQDFDELENRWKDKIAPDTIKFVPASGAASRMFKALNYALNRGYDNISEINNRIGEIKINSEELNNLKDFQKFWNVIKSFPFFSELDACLKSHKMSLEKDISEGKTKNVLRFLLTNEGLNYTAKPKLLLTFHLDGGRPRLAMEEHIKEAVWLTGGRVHFTISPEFLPPSRRLAEHLKKTYSENGIELDITFSVQDPVTDTIALTPGLKDLFRTEGGDLFFRQSGHGALSLNLNKMNERYILIQNVDNLPGGNKEILRWKRAFMGYFAKLEEDIFKWAKLLKETDDLTGSKLEDAYTFITDKLKRPVDKKAKKEFLFEAINRPLILAAMVPNVGEPGGGPFAVKDPKTGTISNQIVEEAQQKLTDKKQLTIAKESTHFNPVFLMINTHDAWGNKFDLQNYAKREGGYVFYVEKTDSKGNKFASIDTGLWNGEIADMMILFVEMPLETFGPAKTVLDLSPKIRPFRKDPYPEIIK